MNRNQKEETIKSLLKGRSLNDVLGEIVSPVVEIEKTNAGTFYHVNRLGKMGKSMSYTEDEFNSLILPNLKAVVFLEARKEEQAELQS